MTPTANYKYMKHTVNVLSLVIKFSTDIIIDTYHLEIKDQEKLELDEVESRLRSVYYNIVDTMKERGDGRLMLLLQIVAPPDP